MNLFFFTTQKIPDLVLAKIGQNWPNLYRLGQSCIKSRFGWEPFRGELSIELLEKRHFWCQSLVYRMCGGRGKIVGTWFQGSELSLDSA